MENCVVFESIRTKEINRWDSIKEVNCDICGDYHEDNVPLSCQTGDGE